MKVCEMIQNGKWCWPNDWYERFPMVTSMADPNVNNMSVDKMVWKDKDGEWETFFVSIANKSLSPERPDVSWWKLFSNQVWDKAKSMANFKSTTSDWTEIVQDMTDMGNGNNIRSVIRRLIFAATIYCIWDTKYDKNASSGWKSILELRNKMRKHISCNVRDGASIFLWHDKWWGPDHIGKLINWNECIQKRLDPNTKIKDVIKDDKWKWPDIIQNNSVLKNIHVPKITKGVKDEFFWINKDGKAVNYSTSTTWKDWRNASEKVVWHDLVCYTCEIWGKLKNLAGYNSLPDKWVDILNLMNSKRHDKSIKSVMIRIILVACVYFIWTERNKRFFTNEKHNCKEMISIVVNHVRLKLASLNVKRTVQVEEISRKWKVVFNIRNEDGILMDTKDLQ
ncbi:hypothetical protein Tco_1426279 [Tanacetum coccineum]